MPFPSASVSLIISCIFNLTTPSWSTCPRKLPPSPLRRSDLPTLAWSFPPQNVAVPLPCYTNFVVGRTRVCRVRCAFLGTDLEPMRSHSVAHVNKRTLHTSRKVNKESLSCMSGMRKQALRDHLSMRNARLDDYNKLQNDIREGRKSVWCGWYMLWCDVCMCC